MKRFVARLEPVPHGGLYVVVPGAVASAAHLQHGARVRGTVNGVDYRSVTDAKKQETRARRVATIVETLHAGVPKRRTWKPTDIAPPRSAGAMPSKDKA